MTISLPTQPIVPVSSFTFSHWLPLAEDEAITVREDDLALTLRFDMGCLGHVSDVDEAELPRHVNVLADKVRAEVTASNLTDELADYIVHTDYYHRGPETRSQQEQRLIEEYGALGKRVYLFTISRVNRLISYARVQKGQYWLEEYVIGADDTVPLFGRFDPEVTVNGSEWVRWNPSTIQHVEVPLMDEARFISRDDWEQVGEFVTAHRRPPLVDELLAGAESLAGNGHRRSALTEAVKALEVAVSEFSRQTQAEQAFGSVYAERMDVASLKNQIHQPARSSGRPARDDALPEPGPPTRQAQGSCVRVRLRLHRGRRRGIAQSVAIRRSIRGGRSRRRG